MTNDSTPDLLVEELAESFVARFRRGERPAIAEYTRRYPELARQIEEVFPALVAMERVNRDLQQAVPAPAETPTASSTIGGYRIIGEIGRGGMGVVYEAEQVSLGRRVALKVLSGAMLANPQHRKRFEREARAAARLHHTNIVPVFGVGEQEGVAYYVMQFIQGQALDEVLKELRQLQAASAAKGTLPARPPALALATHHASRATLAASLVSGTFAPTVLFADSDNQSTEPGSLELADPGVARESGETAVGRLSDTKVPRGPVPLPGQSEGGSTARGRQTYWQSIARIGLQVADALQYAHEQGVIHRDIKPANLLLDLHGTVWVTDFGLAKASDQHDLTHTGDVLGTLRYMAPEQFDGQADARSDVYALGLTLYELLALRSAFDECDRQKLIRQVTTGTPPRLRSLDPQLPRDLETVIHKAIDRDPGHRYQSAGDLAADLRRYLGDEPILARRISPVAQFRRWCRKNPAVAGLTSTIALLVTGAAVAASIAAVKFEQLASDNGTLAGDLRTALAEAEHNLELVRDQEQIAQKNLTLANTEKQRTEEALTQVTTEQQRAEGNLDLALQALDAVYLDAIGEQKLLGSPRSRPQAGEAGFSPSASAPLSDLEKELLKRGLKFYDQFAQQNATTPRATVQTAQAHYRVGLLQAALQDHDAAKVAFQTAVERFEALAKQEPQNVEHHRRLAESCHGLAMSIAIWDDAKPWIERSISSYTVALGLSPGSAALHNARGWANYWMGRSEAHKEDLIAAADLAPDNLEFQYSAALCLYFTNSNHGRQFGERAWKLDPDGFQGALTMAFAFPGDGPEHLKYLSLAIDRNPKSTVALIRRAQAYNRRGEYQKALLDLKRALEVSPTHFLALAEMGRAYLGLRNYPDAEQALHQSLSINPHYGTAHWYSGDVAAAQQQFEEALRHHSQALALQPQAHHIYKRRAEAYLATDRPMEALQDLKTAFELNPKDGSTVGWIPAAQVAACPNQEFKQAMLQFATDAIEKNPATRAARMQLAFALGRTDLAREDMAELAKADNAGYRQLYELAMLSLADGRNSDGYKSACQQMLTRFADSTEPETLAFTAWTCALRPSALADYASAVALAQRGHEAHPEHPQLHYALGALQYRTGDVAGALQTLASFGEVGETAVGAKSSSAYPLFFLALVQQKLGQAEQARATLTRASNLAEQEFSRPDTLAWNRKLTLELLREEAIALIGPVAIRPPAPALPEPAPAR